MPSGGYNKKDLELLNKGYTTVNEMAKEFGRNRASIVTVLKYLGVEPSESIGKHLFYTQSDKEQIAEFYEKRKDDFSKFLASEMRKRKNGGNGYSKERSDKIHKTKIEKYGENYGKLAYEKAWETCEKLYGDKNYRNKDKMKNTLNENRLKYCKENNCSIFSEIFGTNIDHNRQTLDFCMDNLGINLINYKTVLYIKNEDIEPLKKELKNISYNHTSIGEKEMVEFIKSLSEKNKMYFDLEGKGYKTLNEILNENDVIISNKKPVRQFALSLDKIQCYHPKAHQNVNLYSPKNQELILDFISKSKAEKSKTTNMLKYGVEHHSQLEETKKKLSEINKANSKERTIKRNKTNMERYGTCDFINSDKAKQTLINKYGSWENYLSYMGEERKNRFEKEIEEFCNKNDCKMFSRQYEPCIKHSADFLMKCLENTDITLLEYKNIKFIKNCDIEVLDKTINEFGKNFSHISVGEKEISSFISDFNFDIIENDRNIISPKELDIYIPQKNLAIEFDGLYFHSTKFGKDKNYHLNKTLACEEKGIRLIHIFEDEWLFKRPIVESIIKSALGIYEQKIFARNCKVKEINDKTFRNFCNENHIQGESSSSERIGLFYNDKLVQAVGFCKSRFSKNETELVRMVTKLNTQVVGGFSRLMKHFGKDCISYIDRRLFDGKGYKSSGFEYICTNGPNYYYVKELDRYYRMNFTKKNIAKKFPNEFDEKLTEEQNMEKLGYYRFYDCGTVKVKYIHK